MNSISEYVEPTKTVKEKKKQDNKASASAEEETKQKIYSDVLDNKYNRELSVFTRKERYLKKGTRDVAFTSSKTKIIATRKVAGNVYQDMVLLAQTKQWQAIQVKGEKEFRRNVWLEASSKGMQVKGYYPTEQDLRLLTKRQEAGTSSSNEKTPASTQDSTTKSKKSVIKKEDQASVDPSAGQKKTIKPILALASNSSDQKTNSSQSESVSAPAQGAGAVGVYADEWSKIAQEYAKAITNDKRSQSLVVRNIIESIQEAQEKGMKPTLRPAVKPTNKPRQVKVAKPEKARQVSSER